jgi:hypothetical protein
MITQLINTLEKLDKEFDQLSIDQLSLISKEIKEIDIEESEYNEVENTSYVQELIAFNQKENQEELMHHSNYCMFRNHLDDLSYSIAKRINELKAI